jgi:hypothetical protein
METTMIRSGVKLALTAAAFYLLVLTPIALAEACKGFGPQAPRDIAMTEGTNQRVWSLAPDYTEMNLCNIHFHKNAEHKAPGYSLSGGEGDSGGWKCKETPDLTAAELKPVAQKHCENIEPGVACRGPELPTRERFKGSYLSSL